MVAYVALAALATSVIASAQAAATTDVHGIFSRQSGGGSFNPGNIPTACDGQCQALKDATSAGCFSVECMCTSQYSRAISSCQQCAINLVGQASVISDIQSSYDLYASGCRTGGHPVPNVTFTLGANGGSSSSSSSGARAGNAISRVGVAGLACALVAVISLIA